MPRCWLGGSGVMVASGPPSTTARIALAAPHAFEVPGARGPIDASTGFHRHLRRTGADTTRPAAHQDRLSQFDPRVLEQHLPRGDGDDRKARRSNVVERGGLGRDLAGLDQRVLGIAADELVVCPPYMASPSVDAAKAVDAIGFHLLPPVSEPKCSRDACGSR